MSKDTHEDIRLSQCRVPFPHSISNVAASTSSTRTDCERRERKGTLFPERRNERPVNRYLDKVIGNAQSSGLEEEGLVLPLRIPPHCKSVG
jgi:hypothetical protein